MEERDRAMNEELFKIADKIDRLARTARTQDLALMLSQSQLERVRRIGAVVEQLGSGTYLIGSGPYTQGVYSIMSEEVVLGRLATPLEEPLDKPVDIFCQDVSCLTPREVSRQHAMIFRINETHRRYFIRDLGSTCGTYVNGERLQAKEEEEAVVDLTNGDVISLGPSHVNTFVFFKR